MFRMILMTLLAAHTVVTVVTLKDAGVWSVFPPFADIFVYQIFADLAVTSGIVFLLCYVQLKKKQRSLTGLILTMVATALVGSFAPLIFLLLQKDLFDDRGGLADGVR